MESSVSTPKLHTPIKTPDKTSSSLSPHNDVKTPLQSTISNLEEQSLFEAEMLSQSPLTKGCH